MFRFFKRKPDITPAAEAVPTPAPPPQEGAAIASAPTWRDRLRSPQPICRNARPDLVYYPGSIAVWDNTGIRHAITKGVLTLFDIAGIDARHSDPNPDFARAWRWIRHLSNC